MQCIFHGVTAAPFSITTEKVPVITWHGRNELWCFRSVWVPDKKVLLCLWVALSPQLGKLAQCLPPPGLLASTGSLFSPAHDILPLATVQVAQRPWAGANPGKTTGFQKGSFPNRPGREGGSWGRKGRWEPQPWLLRVEHCNPSGFPTPSPIGAF